MSDLDRYYVSEISGYPLNQTRRHNLYPTPSYSVLDRFLCHREIFTAYADDAGSPRHARECKALAEAECSRLNQLEREDRAA